MELKIQEILGRDAESVVGSLYKKEGHGISIRDSDLFFVAFIGSEVAASVRFCVEQGTPMLRTMRVAAQFQKRGVGVLLLKHFEKHLENNQIRGTYCLPYSHLHDFYSKIGFHEVSEDQLPEFLKIRLQENRSKGYSIIAMMRR